MKAISLWQPWASAIALGAKRIETRSWSTSYRGPLAIHAARTAAGLALAAENEDLWRQVLAGKNHLEALPRGAIVATCDLVDVRRVDDVAEVDIRTEPISQRFLGDFSTGRFAWLLARIRPLPEPIPCRGFQRLFDVSDPWAPGPLGLAWGKG